MASGLRLMPRRALWAATLLVLTCLPACDPWDRLPWSRDVLDPAAVACVSRHPAPPPFFAGERITVAGVTLGGQYVVPCPMLIIPDFTVWDGAVVGRDDRTVTLYFPGGNICTGFPLRVDVSETSTRVVFSVYLGVARVVHPNAQFGCTTEGHEYITTVKLSSPLGSRQIDAPGLARGGNPRIVAHLYSSPPPSASASATASPSCAAVPEARWLGVTFYDPQAQQVFLYGGQTLTLPIREVSDMWTWNGRCWTFVPAPGDGQLPTARARELTAYDPEHKRFLLFGGTVGQTAFAFLPEVWSWAGGQWSRLPDAPIVATSDGGAMAYDPSRHELVVVTMPPAFHWGIDDPNAFPLDTWLRNDQGWRQVQPQHKMPFAPVNMIFDSSRDRILASRETQNGTEIWSWDGQDWNLTADHLPGARAVLVDGGDLGILAVDSTGLPGQPRPVYRLNGDQWSVAGPLTTGPSLSLSPAFDQSRRELVTFSDSWQNGAAPLTTDDTWTWTFAAGWVRHAGHAPVSLNPSPA